MELKQFTEDLAYFADLNAVYVDRPRDAQKCIKVNDVYFYFDSSGAYDGWEVDIEVRWMNDIKQFLTKGDASDEFRAYLSHNEHIERALTFMLKSLQQGKSQAIGLPDEDTHGV